MDSEQQKHYKGLLREYLKRYRRAKATIKALQERRLNFIQDTKYPLGAQQYSALPSSNAPSTGSAAHLYRLAEIEERIYAQQKSAEKLLIKVMDVLEYLPIDDEDRSVLELRYIDGYKDKDIMKKKFYGNRSTVSYHITSGLERLIEFKKVRRILDNYEKELNQNHEGTWK